MRHLFWRFYWSSDIRLSNSHCANTGRVLTQIVWFLPLMFLIEKGHKWEDINITINHK